ncbi:ankyrin repeat domain-containing protein [Catenovulum agarivorans]|uniref:ankyrin repeat domain-containing protein n=1 Tax=Catenovulum agarivorans TaxID=1172192 RepID=UPI00035D24E5|nr:ankyrin repeat domain-containing protein [Catenovulum agarivorans]
MNQTELDNALIQAADCDFDYAQELISVGANPNGMPLIMAIQCGAIDIVSLFITSGAELNVHYNETTPLIRAVTSGYPEIVQLLIENGANPEFTDANGKSANHWLSVCSIPRLTVKNKLLISEYIKSKKQI